MDEENVFDFEQSLNYSLPDGFHFVESKRLSVEKIAECCWKGFDHEKDEGLWNGDAWQQRHFQNIIAGLNH